MLAATCPPISGDYFPLQSAGNESSIRAVHRGFAHPAQGHIPLAGPASFLAHDRLQVRQGAEMDTLSLATVCACLHVLSTYFGQKEEEATADE